MTTLGEAAEFGNTTTTWDIRLQHSHRNQWVRPSRPQIIVRPHYARYSFEITEGMAESTSLLIIQYYTQ